MQLPDENKLAKSKKRKQAIAFLIFRILSYSVVAILFIILSFIVYKGISAISWDWPVRANRRWLEGIDEALRRRSSASDCLAGSAATAVAQ